MHYKPNEIYRQTYLHYAEDLVLWAKVVQKNLVKFGFITQIYIHLLNPVLRRKGS